MFQELKYFLEDYWKILLGVLVAGAIIFAFVYKNDGEGSEDLGQDPESEEYVNEDLESETGEDLDVLEGGDGSTDAEEGNKEELIKEISYVKGDSFEFSGAVDTETYKGDLGKYLSKVEVEVVPEGDLLRNYSLFNELGRKVSGCYTSYDFKECVESLSQEAKWGTNTVEAREGFESSYKSLGNTVATQREVLEYMTTNSVKYDLTSFYDALKIELDIRANIYYQIGVLNTLTLEEKEIKTNKEKAKEEEARVKKGKDLPIEEKKEVTEEEITKSLEDLRLVRVEIDKYWDFVEPYIVLEDEK